MKPVSNSEARDLILGCDAKYVSQEQYMIYYDDFSGFLELSAFLSNGCVAVKSDSGWHIHALSADADLPAAIREVRDFSAPSKEEIFVMTWKNIPEEFARFRGSYKFARGWKPYTDEHIRLFTKDDEAQIYECCAPDPDDTDVGGLGQRLAMDFLETYRESPDRFFERSRGLFENGKLIGFVQGDPYEQMKITTINIRKSKISQNGLRKAAVIRDLL